MELLFLLLKDAAFAAIAGIGFGSISNLPKRAFPFCALIAGIGHSLRFFLINYADVHIIWASLAAGLTIGALSVFIGIGIKQPAESLSFPSLLPMIPGMYAYRTFLNLIKCISTRDESTFIHSFYLMSDNLLTGVIIIVMLGIGAVIPIMLFPRIAFGATRNITIY